MRYIRYAFLGTLAIVLLTVALANRGAITLRLLPEEMSGILGISYSITLPLFIVIFGGIIAGLLIGFFWEWLREHKHRAEAVNQRREKERLAKEVARLKPAEGEGDEVLALIEGKSATG